MFGKPLLQDIGSGTIALLQTYYGMFPARKNLSASEKEAENPMSVFSKNAMMAERLKMIGTDP
jgi:hypothetical protein